jgi:hypothetical protein
METPARAGAPDRHNGEVNNPVSRAPASPATHRFRKTDRRRRAARITLPEPVIIGEWWKNRSGEAVRVTLCTYEGHNVVHVRTWFTKDGKLLPGKGFTAGVRHLPRLAKEIAKALDRARELGLVTDEASDG